MVVAIVGIAADWHEKKPLKRFIGLDKSQKPTDVLLTYHVQRCTYIMSIFRLHQSVTQTLLKLTNQLPAAFLPSCLARQFRDATRKSSKR